MGRRGGRHKLGGASTELPCIKVVNNLVFHEFFGTGSVVPLKNCLLAALNPGDVVLQYAVVAWLTLAVDPRYVGHQLDQFGALYTRRVGAHRTLTRLLICEKRMFQSLVDRDTLGWILDQHLFDKVHTVLTDSVLESRAVEVRLALLDVLECLFSVVALEGQLLAHHGVENHSAGPHVHVLAVPHFVQHLGRHIRGRAAAVKCEFDGDCELRKPEVGNFDSLDQVGV